MPSEATQPLPGGRIPELDALVDPHGEPLESCLKVRDDIRARLVPAVREALDELVRDEPELASAGVSVLFDQGHHEAERLLRGKDFAGEILEEAVDNELVKPDETGWLVPAGSVSNIAAAMRAPGVTAPPGESWPRPASTGRIFPAQAYGCPTRSAPDRPPRPR